MVLKQVADPQRAAALAPGAVTSPFDEWALEEALLLKEVAGATVTAVGIEEPGMDEALYRATALGAARTVKLTGATAATPGGDGWLDSHRRAAMLAAWLADEPYDLILSGVQAPDDLDGQLPGLLAGYLGHPYASVVVEVEAGEASVVVTQEFAGGGLSRLELPLPAVLGIQVSLRDPRYVSEMRIRLAGMAAGVEHVPVTPPIAGCGLTIRRTFPPPAGKRAEMLDGGPEEVADAILGLLASRGLLT